MAGEVKGATIFKPGDVLNNTYRIEAILGRGGTSEVYRARSEISGRVVALKALRSEFAGNEDYLALMTREEDMREIRHDGVVRYYHNQRTENGTVYLVMDYVDGPSMEQMLRKGPMPAADLLVVAARVVDALSAAHARNIVHRDLSPDNIILRGGDPADAVIIDFGIAKDTNPGAETIVGNEFAGKYAYAAPEQLSGNTDARSDLYALGALLLAAWRGKAPNVGANPMEVVTNKGKPLDTDGVPEPLRGLIDRLTAPAREARFQNAAEVAAYLRGAQAGQEQGGPEDEERTVIVPRARTEVPPRPVTERSVPPAPKPAPVKPEAVVVPAKGKGGLFAILGVVAVAAGLAGAYAVGLFGGPSFPVADPYVLIAERTEAGAVQAVGSVPDEAAMAAMTAQIAKAGGTPALELASGAIAEGWGEGMVELVTAVADLPEWRVAASGNDVKVTGLTLDAEAQKRLTGSLAEIGKAHGLTVASAIDVGPRFLSADTLVPLLASAANCGELTLLDPPPTGYPNGAKVTVNGRIADVATQVALGDALVGMIGQRELVLDLEVLNPTLCTIDAALPNAPQGGFDVVFGFGDRPDPNPTGRYFVGENPVIDVIIPADVTEGYLYVSALDVSGNVFHLLPNLNRPDDSIATLRGGQTGPVSVRVAYSIADRDTTDAKKLAFVVDETSLGKTKIIVLTSAEPIFPSLRPTTESAGSYAAALKEVAVPVRTLDSRILTTAKN